MAHLTTSPYPELRPYLPPTWSNATSYNNLYDVPARSVEYKDVIQGFKFQIVRIHRHQNIHQFGMFMVRQQHLQVLHSNVNFVKVTRYCRIKKTSLTDALQFNLDDRRLEDTITFTVMPPNSMFLNEVLLVVSFVTRDSNFGENDLTPERDCDLYIEYVIYV